MSLTMFRSLPARLAAGAAAALMLAGTASAEGGKVRVTNGAINPVSAGIEGKFKDIRPRKAATFTITADTVPLSLYFANGIVHRGELEVFGNLPVKDAEGADFWCVKLRDDGLDFDTQANCQAQIDKLKK